MNLAINLQVAEVNTHETQILCQKICQTNLPTHLTTTLLKQNDNIRQQTYDTSTILIKSQPIKAETLDERKTNETAIKKSKQND